MSNMAQQLSVSSLHEHARTMCSPSIYDPLQHPWVHSAHGCLFQASEDRTKASRGCTGNATFIARVHTSASARDAHDGCAWWCVGGNVTAAPAPAPGMFSPGGFPPAGTCWVYIWAGDTPEWEGVSTTANAVLENGLYTG